MESSQRSRAHIILEAARHAANGDIPVLRQLTAARPDALKLDISLRILLTYLPTGTEPELYTDFLRDLIATPFDSPSQIPPLPSTSPEQGISDEEARVRVRRLRLAPLVDQSSHFDQAADPLTLFLLHQAHRIDAETGSLELVSQLLEPFVDHSETLRSWMISNLIPLLRLDYEYYPHSTSVYSLEDFEKLDGSIVVQSLLSKAVQQNDPGDTQKIGRDLRGLVGPWMYGESTRKRRKLRQRSRRKSSIAGSLAGNTTEDSSEWSHVNDWLLELSIRDFQKAVDAAVQWDGPSDVDYGDWADASQRLDEQKLQLATRRYAQANIALLYATNDSSLETIIGSHRTLVQTARLMGHEEPPDLKRTDTPIVSGLTSDYLNSLSPVHLLHNALLASRNPFTSPTDQSMKLFNLVLSSCYKLLNLGNMKTCRSVAELFVFGSEPDQIAEIRKTLHKLKAEKMDEGVWATIRRQFLWLWNWEQRSDEMAEPMGIFSKVARADLENEVLRAMLDGGSYDLAANIYCNQERPPLPTGNLESTIMNAALSSYDAASNGNRTRGGVLKASDIISKFRNYFPNSTSFAQTGALVRATHAMSFYSLTLQHGVPFQPVNIRAHNDPISLIGKILSQNPRSYTHLDDLLEIGQNLVAAGLFQKTGGPPSTATHDVDQEHLAVIARRRIIRMAIEAALEEDDFETAYSYVVNRLSSADQAKPDISDTSEDSEQFFTKQDDISWRAAYQAGRFPTSSPEGSALRRLEQRMELLSQALLLAPASALSEVLAAWQRCEQEVTVQSAREAEEDEKWNEKGERKVPGGFTADASPVIQKARDPARGALTEEAPMGLFDVARGAAAALSKSTFPLRSAAVGGPDSPERASHGRPSRTASIDSSDEGSISGAGGSGRVRKRDMVSSMVTGSLASGIGWVIGRSQETSEFPVTDGQCRCSSCETRMNDTRRSGWYSLGGLAQCKRNEMFGRGIERLCSTALGL